MEYEELGDLPQEWIDLLDTMPDIREEFIEAKLYNEDEMLSPYFFSYFEEDYKLCKPFFLCFERGEAVFNNFYSLYGTTDSESKEINDAKIQTLLRKHMEGMNYLLELRNEKTYTIEEMKFEETTYESLSNEYDFQKIDNGIVLNYITDAMLFNVLPEEEDNPVVAFLEPLYQLTGNYMVIYYILWPLGGNDDLENPFAAYIELWKQGITPYIINDNLVKYTVKK